MYNLVDDNPTMMYLQATSDLVEKGDEVSPRGKLVAELRPACLEFLNPYNRVTFLEGRRINPFFQIAESLWILSGRADVEFLSKFNENMKQFSDDGKWFNAAYGERIRMWNKNALHNVIINPIDQLVDAYRKLMSDKDTRQAVIVISNPMFDNSNYTINESGHDIACLTGDTIISSPEGNLTIKEIVDLIQQGVEYPVYSYNVDTQTVEIKPVKAGAMTRRNAQVMKITMKDGTVLKVTPDHKMYVKCYTTCMAISEKGNKYPITRFLGYDLVEAVDLKVGDRLPYLLRYDDGQGYMTLNMHKLSKSISQGIKEHVYYMEYLVGRKLESNEIVHHKDHNRSNNSAQNLEIMNRLQHDALDMKGNTYSSGTKKSRTPSYLLTKTALWNTALNLVKSGKSLTIEKFQSSFEGVGCLNAVNRHYGTFKAFKQQVYESLGKKVPNGLSGSKGDTNSTTIASIEYLAETEDVYDITVEDNHNFFANGYLVHNCNLVITFKIRHNKLNMTVFNRSNDLHWGVFGANLCQFSTIQETMLSWLKGSQYPDLEMGTYCQITDSLHIYLDDYGFKITNDVLKNYKGRTLGEVMAETAAYNFPDEPRMTLSMEKFDAFLSVFWNMLNPYLMDDEFMKSVNSREEVFGSRGLLMSMHDKGAIDDYWLFGIQAMVTYRLVKLGLVPEAVGYMSNMIACQWKVSMLYFLKKFIHKLMTGEDGDTRYQRAAQAYLENVTNLMNHLQDKPSELLRLEKYLKLHPEQ